MEMIPVNTDNNFVIMRRFGAVMSIILNRPETLNSLNLEMVRSLAGYMAEALKDETCRLVLFFGMGERGFCAGGDLKRLVYDFHHHNTADVYRFFIEECALDLAIFQFPKPVIVIADGITMGGGLGIAAGADWIIATEKTRMAMPETRIGFFPDVGATGWMFKKCPSGYPEYLALTSHEVIGVECVRLGLATHYIDSKHIQNFIRDTESFEPSKSMNLKESLSGLMKKVALYFDANIATKRDMDHWIAEYFAGRSSLQEIIGLLQTCRITLAPCDGILSELHEKSPTAMVLTLKLLRHNEFLPISRVFETDFRAIQFIVNHPDFFEGIRARLIDKDHRPRWQPDDIDQVDLSELRL
jgi:enoyl-CoA hydratase/carnithine racemase